MNWKALGIVLWKITKLCFKVTLVFLQIAFQETSNTNKNANKYMPSQAREKRENGEISFAEYSRSFDPD